LRRVASAIEAPDPDMYKFHLLLPELMVFATSRDRTEVLAEAGPALSELIAETPNELVVPHLNERLDIDYVIRSAASSIDETKILTVETVRLLNQYYWPTSIRALQRALRQILRVSTDQYVRPVVVEPFLAVHADDVQPCPSCSDSVIKRDKCLTIRRTWHINDGNVSLVSRKLGLSRTTIYAHLPSDD